MTGSVMLYAYIHAMMPGISNHLATTADQLMLWMRISGFDWNPSSRPPIDGSASLRPEGRSQKARSIEGCLLFFLSIT